MSKVDDLEALRDDFFLLKEQLKMAVQRLSNEIKKQEIILDQPVPENVLKAYFHERAIRQKAIETKQKIFELISKIKVRDLVK